METYYLTSSLPLFPIMSEHPERKEDKYQIEVQAEKCGDNFHSIDELYDIRLALNVALFNYTHVVDRSIRQDADENPLVVKALLHYDGTMFEGGYFIVAMNGPDGLISFHYKLKHWDKFKIPTRQRVPWEYDGHTMKDVFQRLIKL